MALPPLTQTLSPDAAVLLATVGVCLIFFECNRPGSILPGALGLLCTLLAVAALRPFSLKTAGVVCLVLSSFGLAVSLHRKLPRFVSATATIGLIVSFRGLVEQPKVSWITAVLCGGLLGGGSTFLADTARRAREAKQLHRQSR